MEIAGKVAVVSGGGSGIGRATVLELARRGARVIVADIDEAGARQTADLAGAAGGIAIARRCDVTRTEDLAGAMACAFEHWGALDIVFNNAGIGGEDLFADDPGPWERIIEINLIAVIDATRIAVREMRRSGKGGVIINTASMGGLLPMPDSPVYAASKAGVVNFTRSLAHLAAQDRIRVNAICPSFTDTPLVRRSGDARVEEVAKLVGGILQPEDVAAGVIELIEDDSRAGAIMRVTVRGGRDFAREVRPY
ncbi:MAG: SDR family NAD(P)-dependent oxidoreductase [Tepidiforma sp.]|jgi:NAD(P)-dependent dehydrogenase (short-subunit alcohol dehydrogenase family)|uniref:SDR family NAD(P)-dependent oxidoreductase n=1 Tax=Tepidiforma sp. TaxID=2682230 RepID=UPI0021DBCEE2|nr:SDR family NAD(P)-dependent oxidoreductase [Tepidiforma sp.]MCX7617912.1 SDR family NAD(P)-dependent oxidoreductase [Tepidiforma sp.]GIW18413.1 MAG: short chain dehydrogenase [Tepidiforma sp.]